jgi:hypothetical protein
VIHYEPAPAGVCPGKDRADTELAAYLDNELTQPSTYRTMLATWAGNVTCLRCKAYLKANKERRKRMGAPRRGKAKYEDRTKQQQLTFSVVIEESK